MGQLGSIPFLATTPAAATKGLLVLISSDIYELRSLDCAGVCDLFVCVLSPSGT